MSPDITNTLTQRLRWFGQVMRGEEDYVGNGVMTLDVQGTRKRGQARAAMGGQTEGGHGRERRTTRADAGPSCVEATRLRRRP